MMGGGKCSGKKTEMKEGAGLIGDSFVRTLSCKVFVSEAIVKMKRGHKNKFEKGKCWKYYTYNVLN